MTPPIQAIITAEPGHVLTDDDHACLRLINAVPAAGALHHALVVFRGGDVSLIPWARREGLKVYDWRESGPVDPRQA
ncbi:MAG: hypothetical protein AB7K86_08375 [Rhodospirillales bacterium]